MATVGRIELYQHGLTVDAALAEAASTALAKMESLLGMVLDTQTLGARVRIVVAASTTVSHVWRGYDHSRDPKGLLFLNPVVARLALTGRNATYAHEMAHLLTWRFSSHTLREGLADLLALAVHPGAGVRPNVKTYAAPPAVPEAVWAYLGTTRAPPAQLMSDVNFRKAYCYASWRFVDHLVLSKGLPVFLKLYAAADPGPDFERLCGASLADLVALAAR